MASSTPTRAAPPKSAYFENDVEIAVDDAPETPRAMLERRPEGVYTVGIARRARAERDDSDGARGAPDVARAFALEDEDGHHARLASATASASASAALRRVGKDPRWVDVQTCVVTILTHRERASETETETETVDVLIQPRGTDGGGESNARERGVGVFIDLDAARETSPRHPHELKYSAWVRERVPFERRLAEWNAAHPNDACVEYVMTRRVQPEGSNEWEHECLEGLTTNFATLKVDAKRETLYAARDEVLEGLAMGLLKRCADATDAGRGAYVSELLANAFAATFLTNALKGCVAVDFAIVIDGETTRRVEFPKSLDRAKRIGDAMDKVKGDFAA
jgi:hypothetical protein